MRPGGDRRPGPGGGHGDALELAGRGDAGQRVSFTWPDTNAAWLSRLDGVDKVAGSGPLAVRVAAALAGRGVAPDDFRTHHPDLEDVFLALTGRDLRA